MNTPMKMAVARGALRVAVVTETYPPEINGVARTVGLMVVALLARGHEVQLVRPRQGRESVPPPGQALRERLVPGVAIPFYRHLQIGLASPSLLHREWRHWRPDLVHVVTEGPLGWAAVSAARRLAIPVCSDFHTNFHSYTRHYGFGMLSGVVARYLRALHNRADCTLVPTAEMRASLEALAFERVAVVGRGVDTQLFNPARRSERLRATWGCSGSETVVLHVGRIAPEKNLGLFVDAVLGMQVIDPEVRVVLVGDGPQGPALRKRHPEFVFAGMRTGEDLAEHYASADVFLFPSVTETFGNVTLEAMASGLAVVAYDYAAAQHYLRDGVSGLLAPEGDTAEFVRMAAQLARNHELRPRFGLEARRTAEAASWDRAFDDLERVLRNIAGTARLEYGLQRLRLWDQALCIRFNRVVRITPVCWVFRGISRLGDGVFWYSLMLALLAVDAARAFAPVARMAATGLVCTLLYKWLKSKTSRPRPFAVENAVRAGAEPLDPFSFPSGHTLHAVAFSVVAIAFYPMLAWLLVPFTVLVATSRVVLGLHYPSDVLAGAALGALIAQGVLAL